jgi:hypothetical protein
VVRRSAGPLESSESKNDPLLARWNQNDETEKIW